MTEPGHASGGKEPCPPARRGRHRFRRPRVRHWLRVGPKMIAALVSAVLIVVIGVLWIAYRNASAGITRSDALAGEPPSPESDQNILVMGLDGRRDQQGRPLPQDMYDALHAGDEDSGDNDADVLIVLHLSAGTGPVTAISIPRDDYVDLAECPTSDCRGKIKEAYSLAYRRVVDSSRVGTWSSATTPSGTPSSAGPDAAAQEQAAREAGRKAEISTVTHLLQIPIDHFIEITLAGFFEIARVVQPITVCLNEDTSDPYYSGADFHKGIQQISGTQALAFVRQRRDANDESFTDLDRTRRQQAFIASLVAALHHSGALSSPSALLSLLNVARQNIAIDAGFDLDGFIHHASALTRRPVELYTLPVTDFREIPDGEDVNIIDVPTIRSIVHDLVAPDSPSTIAPTEPNSASADSADTTQSTTGSVVLDVINASGQQGAATALEKSLAAGRFSQGTTSTADSISENSSLVYGPGAQAAATALADELHISATASDAAALNTVQLTVGTDSRTSEYFPNITSTSESPTASLAAPVPTVPATATGTATPAPGNLTRMTADDIPCVK